jgi:hypothetical protein
MKFLGHDTHPIADAFPMLAGDEWERFLEDVKLRKLIDDELWIYKGRILDARNRARAAELLGLEMKVREYTGDDPLGFVLSRNMHRRQMTIGQRALVATKLASFTQGRPKKSGASAGLPQKAVAASLGIDERRIREAKTVVDQGVPELVAALDAGDVDLKAAAAIAELPEDEQRERLKAELAPAPRPRRPRNDNEGGERTGPPPAQALMRVIRRAIEALGGTIKTLRPVEGHGAELLVAYGGQVFSVSLATQADAEMTA